MKTFFMNDYGEGAHPIVMQRLLETNMEHTCGYGLDDYSLRAADVIREKCGQPGAAVHIMVGGTSANSIAIAAFLRPYEAAICAPTGHINVHETGAVEATGHKALALPSAEGKITAAQVREACEKHLGDATHEHMVRPAMVYISYPTELGTLYTRKDLEALYAAAQSFGLKLFIDGARMSYGLAADPTVDLPFLATHCDAFTLGGTKCGALFGEALVLPRPADWPFFRYHIKQRGAMLAKGRLLGVQFLALMENGRYQALGAQANGQAQRIKTALLSMGIPMLCDTVTNQIFPVLPNTAMEILSKNFSFAHWQAVDERHTAVRFCAGATTPEANVEALLGAISALAAP